MKLKKLSHAPPMVFSPEEHKRVVAVFVILLEVERRLNLTDKKAKKGKAKLEEQSYDAQETDLITWIYFYACLLNNALIEYLKMVINHFAERTYDRHNSHHHPLWAIYHSQARAFYAQCIMGAA